MKRCFSRNRNDFGIIPGKPLAYWASKPMLAAYSKGKVLSEISDLKHGMTTGKNETCLKEWWEVNIDLICFSAKSQAEFETSRKTYVPYNKGGPSCFWYGNMDYVLGYNQKYNDYMDSLGGHRHDNPTFYYKPSVTWSLINTNKFGARYRPNGSIFDVSGMSLYPKNDEDFMYVLSLMCSKLASSYMALLNPTVNSQVGDVARIPCIINNDVRTKITVHAQNNVHEAKNDWDSFETSWDFKKHPLV